VDEKLQQTINKTCDWINESLDSKVIARWELVPEMIKALAELVSAKANSDYVVSVDKQSTKVR